MNCGTSFSKLTQIADLSVVGFSPKKFWRLLTVLCAHRLAGYLLMIHLVIGYLLIERLLMVVTDQQLVDYLLMNYLLAVLTDQQLIDYRLMNYLLMVREFS